MIRKKHRNNSIFRIWRVTVVMQKLRTAMHLLFNNPTKLVELLMRAKFPVKLISDEVAVKIMYRMRMGKILNLRQPTTFNEKLLWLMLFDRNSEYTNMVDKYEAKKIILEKLGEKGSKYIIPTIGIYNSFDEIDLDTLPNRFVLKATHDSGSVFLCKDKATFDFETTGRMLEKSLKKNYYWEFREWPYKNIKPRIICEEMLETEDNEAPKDYKIFCMDGIPEFFFIVHDRGKGTKFDFLDMDWRKMPVAQHYPNSNYVLNKPEKWDEIIECAKKLSRGIPHVRIDFFIDKFGNPYVGELTFTHFSGLVPFEPAQYDYIFGDMITLPDLGDESSK